MLLIKPDIWYVDYGPDNDVKTDGKTIDKTRSVRTFKSEIEAKVFAMENLSNGGSPSAGTLDPHHPRRIIGATQIELWADPGLGG